MKRIKDATVLSTEKGDIVLYPGRIYRLNTGKTMIGGCEFVCCDSVNEKLFFRIDDVEVRARLSNVESVEEE